MQIGDAVEEDEAIDSARQEERYGKIKERWERGNMRMESQREIEKRICREINWRRRAVAMDLKDAR